MRVRCADITFKPVTSRHTRFLCIAAMTWQGAKPPEKESKYFRKPDESVLAGLNFDQTEVLFRKLVSMAMLL